MPPRPYWKGYLKLSLVTFPVALYTAIATGTKLAFHQVQRSTGARIREAKVVPGSGEVPPDDIAKGYEFEKGRFVLLEDEDFDKVRLETRKTIELDRFFPAAELDPIYIDKPYYLVPDGAIAEEAFTVVREALAHGNRAALGRVVLSGRERLVGLAPRGKGMVLYTLHTADMVKKPGAYFEDIRDQVAGADEVAVAEALVERRAGHFDPGRFVDRYQEGLRQIIEAKLQGQVPAAVEEPQPANVVNLMDVLKRSLASESGDYDASSRSSAP
jgi:DNA end-binding protein Ku